MAEDNKTASALIADIYGKWNYVTPEEKAVKQGINEMLQSQRRQAEVNRTDARRMAQVTALGDVLRTAFSPVSWAIAGGNTTSQTIAPDNRAYISAFNNAIKADNDYRNIGSQQEQFKLNYAMNEANKARAWREKRAEAEAEQALWDYHTAVKHQNDKELANIKNQWRMDIEKTKGELRGKYQKALQESRNLDIDSKLFIGAVRDAQAAYKAAKWRLDMGQGPEGATLPEFRDYFVDMFPEWASQYDSFVARERTVAERETAGL